MSDSGEAELVERLRSKDKGAFELVFNQFYHPLIGYAMRFLDTSEDAEEIVQDVFVKFWDKCEDLVPDSSVKSYLYRSVHNTCLNQLKHQKVRDNYRDYVISRMQMETEAPDRRDPDLLRQKIIDEIEQLPPRCAQIFKLSRLDGLKYQEIADHLGISIKTVEVQMGKALKVLREKLAYLKSQ